MKSQEIRQSFIDFFAERDHRHLPSAPLVPHGDATLMFTNAGMVQFKDVFLGKEQPVHPRAVTSQKCLRVSGKHNDLENVGPSPRHHTFFEMLGNFSFGDYFKDEAIRFGWDLVTKRWGLSPEHLFATVFEEDDEAEELWRKISGLPPERILRCGAADNFWAMGDTGPCGPCSEIFVDCHPDRPHVDWEEGSDSGRYLEIWNLVFMQFNRDASGKTTPLPNPSIDTGAGLERVSAVLQGVATNYDTDLFQPILRATAALAGTEYGRDPDADVSLRVIGDHLRAVAFLLADGVIPAPDGRGYVLRRLLRRAARHGMRIGFEEPFLHRLLPVLDEVMGFHYPELAKTLAATKATVSEEEEKYLATRARGARKIQEAIDRARADGTVSGEEMFQLYDTYGQEIEAIREIAEEEQLKLDEAGFERLLADRQQESRAATGELQKRLASLHDALDTAELEPTAFEGYDLEDDGDGSGSARVLRLAALNGEASEARSLDAGRTGVAVLDRTPFYAESGGQVGDQGELEWDGGRARVTDTQKDTTGSTFHFLKVLEGSLEAGAEIQPRVDRPLRRRTERNHTATHLLHAALRQVLGEGVHQKGSLVAPDRLRFDFSHGRPMTAEEMQQVEDLINDWVRRATTTEIRWRSREDALADGAMALFGEKYGAEVRTVEVPGVSLELCGGCHLRNTGEIGLLLITSERGVASGIRRIEAVTGAAALARLRDQQSQLAAVERTLAVPAERAAVEADALKGRVKELERELADLRRKLVSGDTGEESATEVEGIRVVAREVPRAPKGELRNLADTLRDKLGSGVVVLASRDDGKVSLIATVSKDLTSRLSAGRLVADLAQIVGGRGGGRPDFAQAGGKEPDKLPQLLESVPEVLRRELAAPG